MAKAFKYQPCKCGEKQVPKTKNGRFVEYNGPGRGMQHSKDRCYPFSYGNVAIHV